jgi:hypothetical protein
MRLLAWGLAAFLGLLWTAGAWMGAALTEWASAVLQSGNITVDEVRRMPLPEMPEWLRRWGDFLGLTAWRDAMLAALSVAQRHLPMLGGAMAWLVPLIWVVWGGGLALLIAGTAGLLRLMGRHQRA